MGLRVNTNISSLLAQRGLARANRALQGNFRRLSTGLRISTAADDAAGLAISERLRAQIRSLDQAGRNANDGISLVQTAEGALNEASNILIRLRELAIQANNGTLSNADKETLDAEFQSLVSEVDRIGASTQFNGINLFDGSASSLSLQVGTGTVASVDTITVSIDSVSDTTLGIDSLDIGSGGDASAAITAVDSAIDSLSSLRGRLGATQSRLDSVVRNLSSQSLNLQAAESRIRDVDVARETSLLSRNIILQQISIAILAQANSNPKTVLSLLSSI